MAKAPSRSRKAAEERLAPLLDQLAEAFEQERFQEVVALAEQALAREPWSIALLHYQAAAHVELEQHAEAMASFERALAAAPGDPELLRDMAGFLAWHHADHRESVERALALCVRGRKAVGRKGDPELLHELLVVEGRTLNQVGEPERALRQLEEALELVPGAKEAELERAVALFELCRFPEAEKAFRRLAEQCPDEAWAHHHLGLLAERSKDAREARKRFARARELEPEEFPAPVELKEEEFDAAVEDAIRRLPESTRRFLDNTTIAVEDVPSDEDLLSSSPPLSPSILGVFRGVPVGERSVSSAWDHFPASILLYRRNLERFARTREELIEQIGITLMHEVGHLLGLDEEDLWERGLE